MGRSLSYITTRLAALAGFTAVSRHDIRHCVRLRGDRAARCGAAFIEQRFEVLSLSVACFASFRDSFCARYVAASALTATVAASSFFGFAAPSARQSASPARRRPARTALQAVRVHRVSPESAPSNFSPASASSVAGGRIATSARREAAARREKSANENHRSQHRERSRSSRATSGTSRRPGSRTEGTGPRVPTRRFPECRHQQHDPADESEEQAEGQ